MSEPASTANARNVRLLLILGTVVVSIVLFSFLIFPRLYSLWCRVTGTELKPNDAAIAAAPSVGTGRFIKVFVESKVFHHLPIEFTASPTAATVEVGRDARVTYSVINRSDQVQHIRPIHQVSPINAARAFGMKICFCFKDQVLQPGERKEFPVVYTFSPDLDARVATVTLCYSIFEIAPGKDPSPEQRALELELKKAIVEEAAP
jgi:cytochrome c oxidase assembly protein subunit 11